MSIRFSTVLCALALVGCGDDKFDETGIVLDLMMVVTTTTGTTTTATGTTTTTTGTTTGTTGTTTGKTGTDTSTKTTDTTPPAPVEVELAWGMSDRGYMTEIRVGDTVTWTITSGNHTVTSTDNLSSNTMTGDPMDSGFFGSGESWSFTFDEAGTYSYRCDPHASMTGTVVVSE
jgi:plastocyanin